MSSNKVTKKSIKRVIKEEIETYLLLERMIHDLKNFENQLNEGVINEGMWDTVKHWVSKLGSVTGGAKGLGKSKKAQQTAAQLSKAMGQTGNKQVKEFAAKLKEEFPEFPNMKDEHAFTSAAESIAQFYDSLAAAVEKFKLGQEQEGALDPVSANAMLKPLRMYVMDLLDSQLADIYKHFKEEKEKYSDEQMLEIQKLIDEVLLEVGEKDIASAYGTEGEEFEVGEEEEGYEGSEGDEGPLTGEEGEVSRTEKGLKSRVLPLVLGALGAGFGAAHLTAMEFASSAPPMLDLADVPKAEWEEVTKQYWTDVVVDGTREIEAHPGGMLKKFMNAAGTNDIKDLAGNIDKIAADAGTTPEAIFEAYGETARMGDDSSLGLKAVYEWGKQGGAPGAWNRAGKPSAEFLDFVKTSVGDDAHELLSATQYEGGAQIMGLDGKVFELPSWRVDPVLTNMPTQNPEITSFFKELHDAPELAKQYAEERGLPDDWTPPKHLWDPEEIVLVPGREVGAGAGLGRAAQKAAKAKSALSNLFATDKSAVMAIGTKTVLPMLVTYTVKELAKTGGKLAVGAAVGAGAGTTAAGALLLPLLAPIGIGLAGAGIAIGLLRKKGLKSSRFAKLKAVHSAMKNFEVPEEIAPLQPGGEEAAPPPGEGPKAAPDLGSLSSALGDAGASEKIKSFIVQHVATQLKRQGLSLKEIVELDEAFAEYIPGTSAYKMKKAIGADEEEPEEEEEEEKTPSKKSFKPFKGTMDDEPEEEEIAGKEVSGEKKPGTPGAPQIAVYSHPAGPKVKRDLKQALADAGASPDIVDKLLDIVANWGKSQNLKINENVLCKAICGDLVTESTFSRWKKMAGILKG